MSQYASLWPFNLSIINQPMDQQTNALMDRLTARRTYLWLWDKFLWFYNLFAISGEVMMCPATKDHVNCNHCHVLRYTSYCLKLSHTEWLNGPSLSLSLSLSLTLSLFVRERPVTRGASGVGISVESFLLLGETTPSVSPEALYIYIYVYIKRLLKKMSNLQSWWRKHA